MKYYIVFSLHRSMIEANGDMVVDYLVQAEELPALKKLKESINGTIPYHTLIGITGMMEVSEEYAQLNRYIRIIDLKRSTM